MRRSGAAIVPAIWAVLASIACGGERERASTGMASVAASAGSRAPLGDAEHALAVRGREAVGVALQSYGGTLAWADGRTVWESTSRHGERAVATWPVLP